METTSRTQRIRALVPNTITCTSLVLGLVSIFFSFHGKFEQAGWLLMVCVLLDKLDGTTARLLGAGSEMGMELDSFSDLITFCVAPGVIWAGLLGSAESPFAAWPMRLLVYGPVAFFVLTGALRLAKFNCAAQSGEGLKGFFQGIPTTLAGATMTSLLVVVCRHELLPVAAPYVPPLFVLLGLLMVSRLYLPKVGRRKSRPVNYFTVFNAVTVPVLILLRELPEYLLFLALLYMTVGLTWANRKGVEIQ
ncbi:MAG: hypothetical protein FJ109_01425 [Deltaproteobacteria bacterium]|nr:hypothetical protein [Deltaproteobacteria bacterium]